MTTKMVDIMRRIWSEVYINREIRGDMFVDRIQE